MRVLMFGWEFPPHISGGLGSACHGITWGLARKGVRVVFVLPRRLDGDGDTNRHLRLVSASGTTVESPVARELARVNREIWERQISLRELDSLLYPYATEETYAEHRRMLHTLYESRAFRQEQTSQSSVLNLRGDYGPDLLKEVYRYSLAAAVLAMREKAEQDFDVIHVHDWMTYPAGMLARAVTGRPLIAHLHATEYDRSGENINPQVAAIEKAGLLAADLVIAVSHFTRDIAIQRYGVPPEKIMVVHNAVSRRDAGHRYQIPVLCRPERRVLFLGRVTFQKGPDYFVEAARLVLEKIPEVRFIMAGSGDMLPRMVRRVSQLRMGSRFHFTGFMRGDEVDRMFAMSDLYVMPSVSEPFGITPLEALLYDVPVLLSRQSGVSEVLRNALKVDFWDIREMANKICAVLAYPRLAAEMVKNCREEMRSITWDRAAERIVAAYRNICQGD